MNLVLVSTMSYPDLWDMPLSNRAGEFATGVTHAEEEDVNTTRFTEDDSAATSSQVRVLFTVFSTMLGSSPKDISIA